MGSAFQVTSNGQIYDYRIGENLNLEEIKTFFKEKYAVVELHQMGRHITGILNDGSNDIFLKLATTPGIGLVTQNEYKWNEEFNKEENGSNFRVPKNITSGQFNNLFYFLAEKLDGKMVSATKDFALDEFSFPDLIPQILDLAVYVMSKNISGVGKPDVVRGITPQDWFVNKTRVWFDAIPNEIKTQNNLHTLMELVEASAVNLATKPRHGDFTPWHIMKLTSGGLGLIDGEHAMSEGVELYDIGYLIQRVHTICKRPDFAVRIFEVAEERGIDARKLKTIMSARTIGGFLDAHLAQQADLSRESEFKKWVLSL